MAGFLQAIGQASPAISGAFKDYLDTAKSIREEEKDRQALEMKQETHATQQAVSGLAISKMKREEAAAQKKETEDNAIVDVNPMYSALKLNPGFREVVDTVMGARNVKGGIGAAKDVRAATKDLEQHPLLPKLIEGQIEYVRSGYMVAKQEYDKIVEKKGKPGYDINKEYEAHKNLKEWEKNGVAFGLVDKKVKERDQNKQEISKFIEQFPEFTSTMSPAEKTHLQFAHSTGDMDEVGKMFKAWEEREKEQTKVVKKKEFTPQKFTRPDGSIGWVTPGEEAPKGWKPYAKPEKPEKPSDFDKKWGLATNIAKESKPGKQPTTKEIAESYKTNFGSTDFLSAILAGDVKPPTQTKETYEVGKVYTDAKGKKAKYLGDGKWQPM